MSEDSKLNLILEKLEKIEYRLDRLEDKTDDLHYYIPFVDWLEQQGKRLAAMASIPWKREKVLEIENVGKDENES